MTYGNFHWAVRRWWGYNKTRRRPGSARTYWPLRARTAGWWWAVRSAHLAGDGQRSHVAWQRRPTAACSTAPDRQRKRRRRQWPCAAFVCSVSSSYASLVRVCGSLSAVGGETKQHTRRVWPSTGVWSQLGTGMPPMWWTTARTRVADRMSSFASKGDREFLRRWNTGWRWAHRRSRWRRWWSYQRRSFWELLGCGS